MEWMQWEFFTVTIKMYLPAKDWHEHYGEICQQLEAMQEDWQ